MNNYNIPADLEEKIRNRDNKCVYCSKSFDTDETIEHIDNDVKNISENNIAICCRACNSSKGNRLLHEWLNTNYCKKRNINIETVSDVIKNILW
ncbi:MULTISPECIES: HNH endonuclease [unclassified Treponema]|uniref:HNH endonuclease n=1 Tax=unclassified Treponema TaxID=2638727 RepID=UPI0020A49A7A|nr:MULTISPECIES: HNH endonuclease [unclassified Treponema]UTC67828.1 HNH endonuclease [Treponema sp. OMZ 789]UTC70553.1 HNH endonuclease [Treponema sp. OMZ 790]UTC73266.1 HNH endonuclease [Treponema sp. OMZ 791]